MSDESKLNPQQVETRRKQAVTILKHRTLEDPNFWRDHVSYETFCGIFERMKEIKEGLRELKAQSKLEELKKMGVKLPKDLKIEFIR